MSCSDPSYFYDYDYDTQTIMVYANQDLLQWIAPGVSKQSTPPPPSTLTPAPLTTPQQFQPWLYPGNNDAKSAYPPSQDHTQPPAKQLPPKHVQHPSSSSFLPAPHPLPLQPLPPLPPVHLRRSLQPIVAVYYHKLCCWFNEAEITIYHQAFSMNACFKTDESTLYRALIRLPEHMIQSKTLNATLSYKTRRANGTVTKRRDVVLCRNEAASDVDAGVVVFAFDEEEDCEEEADEIEHDEYHFMENYSAFIKQFISSDSFLLRNINR
eukprot:CAMPEP_0197022910 /NCGR_PEP_ID=MMETSP1384-20130603/3708_1 /TAXON_ID=29189 /ORGANISM="Ammonia sp." /LENGTH=266 /DNA_ID=CAMNT_0042451031 /DNA_START=66 /DNA_END=866 /DNA_ORIENTATION=+